VLDVASPKDKMDGSEVNKAYWDGRLEEIKDYCEKDLVATARVLLRLTTKFILEDEQVEFV
jgi:predicted PolB exonuclease-like 3'-5' exonuclease